MALLIVLGALLVVAVAAATVAHSASIEITRRRVDVETAMAEDLADAAIAPLLAWLRDHSDSAAVHSDSPSPAVKVMDERVMPSNAGASAMVPCRIEINVWDQHGMVPISLIGKPGALANTLPEDVVESMRSVKLPRGAIAGLDLLALGVSSLDSPGAAGRSRAQPATKRAIYPLPLESGTEPSTSSDATPPAIPYSRSSVSRARVLQGGELPSIGEIVATHLAGAGALNVNTAPRRLLDAAAKQLQITLPDAIWERRSAGKLVEAAMIPRPGGASGGVTFTTRSDCWSARVDATAGNTRSSWWLVCRDGDRGWQIVQRTRITSESIEWTATD